MIQSVSDIRFNLVPEKSGIGAAQVLWVAKPELVIDARLAKLSKQSRCLAQIIDVGQLADQIGGAQKAGIVGSTAMLFVLRNGETSVLYIRFNLQRIDVVKATLPKRSRTKSFDRVT